jgi:PilZ domain
MTGIHVGVDGDQLAIRVDMAEVARELGRTLQQCEQTAERARQRWEESEWYLGEARATIARLESRVQAQAQAHAELEATHLVTTTRLQEAELQRDEAARELDESQRAREALGREAAELRDRLAAAQALAEAAQQLLEEYKQVREAEPAPPVQTVEAELQTLQTPCERRRASRVRRSDITLELQRPDGAVLFSGPLRDISRTGVGFDGQQLASGSAELLWMTLHPEGRERPIEALARLSWLRQDESSGCYEGGCELIDVSPTSRSALEEVFGQPV